MADNVPGLTVIYTAEGESDYKQAISTIGRIEFGNGHATLVYKDASAGTYDLGHISEIRRITFGDIDDNTAEDTPTQSATQRTINVTAYPNPTADHIHISGTSEGETIRIFNAEGKMVHSGSSCDINMSGMPNGLYLLQTGKEVVKIIKR